jgi:hypothetical protein
MALEEEEEGKTFQNIFPGLVMYFIFHHPCFCLGKSQKSFSSPCTYISFFVPDVKNE